MALSTFENSEYGYRPVELYEFFDGANYYRYTSADEGTITFDGETYTAAGIDRESTELEADASDQKLQITLPRDNAVPLLFLNEYDRPDLKLRIRVAQRDSLTDFKTVLSAGVLSCTFRGDLATLNVDVFGASFERQIANQCFGPTCQATLYTRPCPVAKADFKETGVVDAISGFTVTASEWAGAGADYFTAGFVECVISGKTYRRFIAAFNSTTGALTLFAPIGPLTVGASVDAYPGCNSSTDHCRNKFGAATNDGEAFVGFPHVPARDAYRVPIL
jgi:uncharacterized phage protein (TIGR02218 family)